jgi:hypothetical protein
VIREKLTSLAWRLYSWRRSISAMFDRETLLRNSRIIVLVSALSWLGVIGFGIWQWSLWTEPKVQVTVVGFGRAESDGKDGYRAHFRRDDDPLKTISSNVVTAESGYEIGQKVTVVLDDGGRMATPVEMSPAFFVPVGILALSALVTTMIGVGMWILGKRIVRKG